MKVSLHCPDYSLINKQAKTVNISIKTSTRGEISHLVIDSTGLKVFGESEWKIQQQHGVDKRRVYRINLKMQISTPENYH